MNEVPNFAPWMNIAVGILTIISPFALGVTTASNEWSAVITGVIIGVVAIIELAVYNRMHGRMSYWPVINILAGIWLFIATSIAAGNVGMIWSNIVLGVCSIVTAIIALGYERVHSASGGAMRT